LRVLYFSRDYTPHDHRFLSALAATSHRVFFLRLERSGPQREDRALPPEVTLVSWRGGQAPARLRDLPALLRDFRRVVGEVQPDLVHAGPVQNAAFLAALAGFRPLVTMSWGSDLLLDADRSLAMRWKTRYTLRRSSVLAGDCEAVRRKAGEYGFPPERVVLFPWGVDLETFTPGREDELRARLGWQDAFVLLSNRAWEPLYGVDVVARAFVQAARQNPNLRLLLLGNGSQAGALRSILSDGGVLERVHFGGQVKNSELARYYRTADLYLSASHSDGSSVSLMEALACGCPALVSDIPTNREWIEEGVQGWLFPDGDAAALGQAILSATAAPLAEIGAAARALAERRANWSHNFRRLLQAYELALQVG
jgi:glycosyltransferase involved in cell wall biosynthesis